MLAVRILAQQRDLLAGQMNPAPKIAGQAGGIRAVVSSLIAQRARGPSSPPSESLAEPHRAPQHRRAAVSAHGVCGLN